MRYDLTKTFFLVFGQIGDYVAFYIGSVHIYNEGNNLRANFSKGLSRVYEGDNLISYWLGTLRSTLARLEKCVNLCSMLQTARANPRPRTVRSVDMPGTITGGVMGGGRLLDRVAKPLNGQEVARAIESHILSLANKILNEKGVYSDRSMELIEMMKEDLHEAFLRDARLTKIHIRYPKVGWEVKVRLEHNDLDEYHMSAEIELDLERNTRIPFRIGQIGFGTVIATREEERIPTSVPDKTRKEFDLPITAEISKPNGEIQSVDLRELQQEKRAARTVDVGSARIPGQEVSQGAPIVLPGEVPEISMDEIAAEPPPPPPTNPEAPPLPPKGTMAQNTRPKARFK